LQVEIAERKEAELALASTNKRLQQISADLQRSHDQALDASKAKSDFLANMSHEIRTPLNAVIGMSDLLVRTRMSDDQRELALTINSSADVLLSLVNDILDYSKIESGKLDLEIVDFDLVELIEGSAALIAEKARSKQLSLSTFVDPSLARIVRGDPARIRQVLLNFLSNSIKFTDRGDISVRAVPNQSAFDQDDDPAHPMARIRFSVSDTGIGLREEEKARLFQPFTQADASITRRYGGTGLGLTICKRLIAAMDGTIDFQSEYGKGTTFGFTLALETSPEQPEKTPALPLKLHHARILLIDGPLGAQHDLNAYISSWGMRCSMASDLAKALVMMRQEAAANDSYDVVVVQLGAGAKEPLSLLSAIKTTPQLTQIKIIVVDPAKDPDLERELIDQGFSAYLSMPVRQSRLFDCISALLNDKIGAEGPQKEVDESTPKESSREPRPGNLVLVVEDNTINQKVALLQLRELGVSAHAVGNGLEALDAVSRTRYALILMDCQMPEMDGMQTTREIRKMETRTGGHCTIVAMTAHAMTSDRLDCLAAGMDDYISKPVTQKKLKDILERWLPVKLEPVSDAVASPQPGRKPVELELLRSTFGEEVTQEYLREFMEFAESSLEQLENAIKRSSIKGVKAAVHDLKGGSATIYATEMAELSRALEDCINEDQFDWRQVQEHMQALNASWLRVRTFIQESGVLADAV